MEGSIVKDVEELTKKGLTVVVDGKTYSAEKLRRVLDKPMPNALVLTSLLSFCDYMTKAIDGNKSKELVVIVKSRNEVALVSHLDKEDMSRMEFILAKNPHEDTFKFGQWHDLEDFVIKLRSLFKQSANRDELVEFLSKVSDKAAVELEDDGITQKVTLNKGVSGAIKVNGKVPAIVKLAPYRTFREIEQPESEFLFRVKSYGDGQIQCSLHEADGGTWKIEAVKKIAEWIAAKVTGATILS